MLWRIMSGVLGTSQGRQFISILRAGQDAKFFTGGQKGFLKLPVGCVAAPHPGHQHNIQPPLELLLVCAVNLPKAAAHAISVHRFAYFIADRDSDLIVVPPVFPAINYQYGRGGAFALGVQASKLIVVF